MPCSSTCPPAVWVESRSKAALSAPACGSPDPENHYSRWFSNVTITGSYNNTPNSSYTESGDKTVNSVWSQVDGECQLAITATETQTTFFDSPWETYSSTKSGTYTNINGVTTCTGNSSWTVAGIYEEPLGSGIFEEYSFSGSDPWCPDTSTYPGSTTTRTGAITAEGDLFPDAIANLESATWGEWSRISYPLPDECFYPAADAPRQCYERRGPYASAGSSVTLNATVAVTSSEYRIVVKVPLSRYVKVTWKEWKEFLPPASGSPVITDRVWEKTFPADHLIEEASPSFNITPTELDASIAVMDLKVICTPPEEREDYSTQADFPVPPSSEEAWKLFNAADRPAMPGLGKTYRWVPDLSPGSPAGSGSYVAQDLLSDCFRSCNYGCTDSNASNYDPLADIDDGSCVGWE